MKKKDSDLIEKTRMSLRKQDYKEIRERWDKEDELLSSRTSMFLTVNAILFAATQLQTNDSPCPLLAASRLQENNSSVLNLAVSAVGFVLTLLWLRVSKHSSDCIHFLFKISKDIAPGFSLGLYEFRRPKVLFPTRVIAIFLPVIVLLCWMVLAFMNLRVLIANNH